MGLVHDYYEDLANAVMETEKSHDLLSRKAGGIIQSESENLRTGGANDVKNSPKAEEDEMRCSSGGARK